MAKTFLSVIIPVHNEAERLPLTLVEVDRYLNASGQSSEILVVDEASTDTTAEIVGCMAQGIKNLKLIRHDANFGKGDAVRRGMLLSGGMYRLFMDADNAVRIHQFEDMLPHLEKGFDVVIGSRALRESRTEPPAPLSRRAASRAGNWLIQKILLKGIADTQCGFKAVHERAAEEIFSAAQVPGWGFDIEMLVLARQFGYRVKEIPVLWSHSPPSKVGAAAYLQTLRETLTIRWRLSRGMYKKSRTE